MHRGVCGGGRVAQGGRVRGGAWGGGGVSCCCNQIILIWSASV